MLIWNRPIFLIHRIISYLRLTSCLLTILLITTCYILNYQPNIIWKIDKILSKSKIKHTIAQIKLLESSKNISSKIVILEEMLQDTSKEDLLRRREIMIALIDEYSKQKNYQKSISILDKLEEIFPMDVEVRLRKIPFPKSSDERDAQLVDFYEKMIQDYPYHERVLNTYITFLFTQNNLKRAIQVTNRFIENTIKKFRDKTFFKIYYLEKGHHNFTETESFSFSLDDNNNEKDFQSPKRNVELSFSKEFDRIQFFRLDIENVVDLHLRIISDIQVTIQSNDAKQFKYAVTTPLLSNEVIKRKDKNGFQPESRKKNPFILLNLPKSLYNYSGKLNITVQFTYWKYLLPEIMGDYLTNEEWNYFFSTQEKEKTVKHISNIALINESIQARIDFNPQEEQHSGYFTVKFPEKYKFYYKNIIISAHYNEKETVTLHKQDKRTYQLQTKEHIRTDHTSYATAYFPKQNFKNITITLIP